MILSFYIIVILDDIHALLIMLFSYCILYCPFIAIIILVICDQRTCMPLVNLIFVGDKDTDEDSWHDLGYGSQLVNLILFFAEHF